MALCSTSQSPLSVFSKHVQVDRALQRDRLARRQGDRQAFRSTRGEYAKEEFTQFSGLQNQIPVSDTQQMILGVEAHQIPQAGKESSRKERDIWLSEFSARGKTPTTKDAVRTGFGPADYVSFQALRAQSSGNASSTRQMGSKWAQCGSIRYNSVLDSQLATRRPEFGLSNTQGYGIPSRQPSVQTTQALGETQITDSEWEAVFAQLEAASRSLGLEARKEKAERREDVPIEKPKQDVKVIPPQAVANETPRPVEYVFEEKNPFSRSRDPFEEGMEIVHRHGNLSFAALAFEAACQQTPTKFEAWRMLGAVQAESEQEAAAIKALEEASKLQPENLEVMMRLAVCYTNEGYSDFSYDRLTSWLQTKYPQIARNAETSISTSLHERHSHLKTLFIKAAQLSPEGEHMDPDVQIALGILFFSTRDYQQAADCFAAAITSSTSNTSSESQSQLHLLWTRYGACLGNLSLHEPAKDAYQTAIQLSPNSMRARYNLGIVHYMQSNPQAGARTLLEALRVSVGNMLEIVKVGTSHGRLEEMVLREKGKERVDGLEGDEEGNGGLGEVYEMLRRCCVGMSRWDLAERVRPGMDLVLFEKELENQQGS